MKLTSTTWIAIAVLLCNTVILQYTQAKDINKNENNRMENTKKDVLTPVFDNYFEVTDALIQSNFASSLAGAKRLQEATKMVNMGDLSSAEHAVWMKVLKNLSKNIEKLAQAKDIEALRSAFALVSPDIYTLMKASTPTQTMYYKRCPMFNNGKGATWLSKESVTKNPYFGSKMLSCGKTIETLN